MKEIVFSIHSKSSFIWRRKEISTAFRCDFMNFLRTKNTIKASRTFGNYEIMIIDFFFLVQTEID